MQSVGGVCGGMLLLCNPRDSEIISSKDGFTGSFEHRVHLRSGLVACLAYLFRKNQFEAIASSFLFASLHPLTFRVEEENARSFAA